MRLNPNLRPTEPYPRYSIRGDVILVAALAGVGYFFLGPLGALAGLALGIVIAFGI